MSANTLVILGTGGTIAGKGQPDGSYQAGLIPVLDLLSGIPIPQGWQVETEQVFQTDSRNMVTDLWRQLLQAIQRHLHRPEVAGVVITHGTDTLEESAFLTHALIRSDKPIVFTCAMRPATALVPDGPQNLADALVVATERHHPGVWLVINGQVFSGFEVQKVHPTRLDAFAAIESGAVARVEGGRCRWWHQPVNTERWQAPAVLDKLLQSEHWPRVEWINSHAGQSGALVQALLAQRHQQLAQGDRHHLLRGLLVAGTGNGTLHKDMVDALSAAQEQGVQVRVSSRCLQGLVTHATSSGFQTLALPPAKARLALMLELVE